MTPTIALATVADILNSEGMEGFRDSPSLELSESIAQGILAFSQQAEQETGRWFKRSTVALPWTEVLDVECGQRVLALKAYPIISIVSIKTDYDGDFSTVTALEAREYGLLSSGRTGQVQMRYPASLIGGVQTTQVVYVGGIAEDVHTIDPLLRKACIEQVRFAMKRLPNNDISSLMQSGGSVSYFRNTALCDTATAIVDLYRRQS